LPKKTPSAEDRQRAFGNALREALTVQKMTQGDLAEALGVRQPTVSGWITGISAPDSVDQTFAIERALKVRPGSLSRHLDYLPLEAVRSVATVRAALMEDPELSADEKSMLLAAYEAATRPKRRKG
jgi:transcriptional regulator with XRE-family HTH domain